MAGRAAIRTSAGGPPRRSFWLAAPIPVAERRRLAARVAGAVVISDGQVHDAEFAPDLPAPLHLLRTGRETDWDRRLIVSNAHQVLEGRGVGHGLGARGVLGRLRTSPAEPCRR